MGKGSGACDRPGISLVITDSAKTELNLSGDVASASEINTTLELLKLEARWWTKDDQVTFLKKREGWIVDSFSDNVHKAFREYGLMYQPAGTSSYEHAYFPSLKAAKQAVTDVSLEAGLNIDSRLTRQKHISYKIGDVPLRIMRGEGHWRVNALTSALPPSLQKHFNSAEEFRASWYTTNSIPHHPTRKAAHQAVINWLSQIIAEEK
jgi:hypothetical protein